MFIFLSLKITGLLYAFTFSLVIILCLKFSVLRNHSYLKILQTFLGTKSSKKGLDTWAYNGVILKED